jgi:hypothetical protein
MDPTVIYEHNTPTFTATDMTVCRERPSEGAANIEADVWSIAYSLMLAK